MMAETNKTDHSTTLPITHSIGLWAVHTATVLVCWVMVVHRAIHCGPWILEWNDHTCDTGHRVPQSRTDQCSWCRLAIVCYHQTHPMAIPRKKAGHCDGRAAHQRQEASYDRKTAA